MFMIGVSTFKLVVFEDFVADVEEFQNEENYKLEKRLQLSDMN